MSNNQLQISLVPKTTKRKTRKKNARRNKRPNNAPRVSTRVAFDSTVPLPAMRFKTNLNSSNRASNRPSHSLKEAICAITDPFCPLARGAKWPDGNGGETLTMQLRSHLTVPTLSSGGNISILSCNLPYALNAAGSYATGSYTLGAAYLDATGGTGTNFTTYANEYRITTAGVIIRSTLPALTAQGYIILSRMTQMIAPSTVVPAGLTTGTDVVTHPLRAGLEVPFTFRTVGSDAHMFYAQNTTTTTIANWDALKIEIVGAPASTTAVVDIEVVYNIEFTLPATQQGLSQFIRPDVPFNPQLTAASTRLANAAAGPVYDSVEKLSEKFMAMASEAIVKGAVSFMAGG